MHLSIKAKDDAARLDRWISENCSGVSRTKAQSLIASGGVKVNGLWAKASTPITGGDEIAIDFEEQKTQSLKPEKIPVVIVYEDNSLLVVDKPPGMTVHPAPGHLEHTLANAIAGHLPAGSEVDGGQRAGIVHRLDKDTSGLILVAKTEAAHQILAAQFKKRVVSKVYLAVVKGDVHPDEGVIEAPIGRDRSHREKMAISDAKHGREARTKYRVLKRLDGHTLIEARPETGRTHQIRVHLSAIGYPIIGDATYGVRSPVIGRQFLHAYKIAFTLPFSQERVEFESPLPPDLVDALNKLAVVSGGLSR